MTNIHWLGTGLSAIPGLKMLIENGHSVLVYNRTVEKAIKALSDVKGDYQVFVFSLQSLEENVAAGDIVVSMLPGNFHFPVAELCLSLNAHFVSSSYISDEMRALNDAAKEKNLCFVNEVGLDPGIDHSMSHALVDDYKNSPKYSSNNVRYTSTMSKVSCIASSLVACAVCPSCHKNSDVLKKSLVLISHLTTLAH